MTIFEEMKMNNEKMFMDLNSIDLIDGIISNDIHTDGTFCVRAKVKKHIKDGLWVDDLLYDDCILCFANCGGNSYDLFFASACIADHEAEEYKLLLYVEDPDDSEKLDSLIDRYKIEEKVYRIEARSLSEVELITPCGDMGTVIDVEEKTYHHVDSKGYSSEEYTNLFFKDVMYLEEGEECFFLTKEGVLYSITNNHGCYNLYNVFTKEFTGKVSNEIKEKIKLI